MGWLFIVVIVILAAMTIIGYVKGLIKQILSVVSIVVTLIAVFLLTPVISNILKENTKIYDKIYTGVEENLHLEKFQGINIESDIENMVDKMELPNAFKKLLLNDKNIDKYVDEGITSLTNYVVDTVTGIVFKAIVFVVTFIIVFVAVKVLIAAIDLISKLPVINEVNKAAGLSLGFVEGLIVVWILLAFATMFGSTAFGQSVFEQVNSNWFLGFLYNNNLILKYILAI